MTVDKKYLATQFDSNGPAGIMGFEVKDLHNSISKDEQLQALHKEGRLGAVAFPDYASTQGEIFDFNEEAGEFGGPIKGTPFIKEVFEEHPYIDLTPQTTENEDISGTQTQDAT